MTGRASLVAALFALALCAGTAAASPGAPEGVTVPSWKDLSNEQQADLAQLQPRWDTLPASRRVMILERHQHWKRLPQDRRDSMRKGERNFRQMTPRQRENMRLSMSRMRGLAPEEQRRLREIWQSLDPRQRRDWLERGGPGLAPPPETAAPREP